MHKADDMYAFWLSSSAQVTKEKKKLIPTFLLFTNYLICVDCTN